MSKTSSRPSGTPERNVSPSLGSGSLTHRKHKLTLNEYQGIRRGLSSVIGIDEAGKGAWAGPLAVGGVFHHGAPLPFFGAVRDSKKLSPQMRESLSAEIEANLPTDVALIDNAYIDEHGISAAAIKGVVRLLEAFDSLIDDADYIVLDGLSGTWPHLQDAVASPVWRKIRFMPRADDELKVVGAASILAKHHRDFVLKNIYSKAYPMYGFETNVGYGSERHGAALEQYGPCMVHRRTFAPIRRVINGGRS